MATAFNRCPYPALIEALCEAASTDTSSDGFAMCPATISGPTLPWTEQAGPRDGAGPSGVASIEHMVLIDKVTCILWPAA